MSLLALVLAQPVFAAPPPCGTPARMVEAASIPFRPWPAPPPGPKPSRDAWGAYPNQLDTENFAIKWGNDLGVTTSDAEAIGGWLETAWADQIDGLGMPAPDGSTEYLFNVYLAGTGPQLPDSYGAAAYFSYDDAGWPMIVIDATLLPYSEFVQVTTAHELFHALQDATGNYPYSGPGDWYSEATATWASGHTHPEYPNEVSQFLWGYAFLPELPLSAFTYPSSGTLEEYHQYGAFVFPLYLSERFGPDFVVQTWVDEAAHERPLDTINTLQNGAIADIFFDFAAASARWDYGDGELFERILEDGLSWGYVSHRIAGSLVMGQDWASPEEALAPRTLGANYWTLSPYDSSVMVDARGPEDATQWDARVILPDGTQLPLVSSVEVPGERSALVEPWGEGDAIVVVSAFHGTAREDAWTLPYALRLSVPVAEAQGCGCRHRSGAGGAWLGAVMALALRRRRTPHLR